MKAELEDWGDWHTDPDFQEAVACSGMEFVTSRAEWIRGKVLLLWPLGPF